MHLVALSLLLAAIGLLLATFLLPIPEPLVGYLRAFAEAALVGGLADWFAVVALFRRPLGLPIPHTAIVPNNKDRIGVALGDFIQANFLTREVLGGQLAKHDLALSMAGVLANRAHAQPLAARLTALIPGMLTALDATGARDVLQQQLRRSLRAVDTAPLIARLLDALLTEQNRERLFAALLQQARSLLEGAEPELRERIHGRSAWLLQRLRVDERIADQVLDGAHELLQEIEDDPQHPWRLRLSLLLDDFIADMRTAPAYRRHADELVQTVLEHPLFAESVEEIWAALVAYLRDASARPDSGLRRHIETSIQQLGEQLQADPEARGLLNTWLRDTLIDLALQGKSVAADLISETVSTWDADTVTAKLEEAVGRDLQFIRVNGTLIGGLIGLCLHALSNFALT